jgi:glutamate synthase domain-containing protein 1
LPVELLRVVVDFELPPPTLAGANVFAVGLCFMPQEPEARAAVRDAVEAIADDEGRKILGWRALPVDPDGADIGSTALSCMPHMEQLFVVSTHDIGGIELDRCVYPLRKRAERAGGVLSVTVQSHHRVQGYAHYNSTATILFGSARRTLPQRHRDRAQPLLHQHFPVVAAGPPVPLRRAQR